jgi:hypothetical protein
MTANQFAEALLACAPPVEKLLQVGLSPQEAQEFRSSYFCKSRPNAVFKPGRDALIELVENYDLSGVEVASLRFAEHPEDHGAVLRLGTFDSDLLIIDSTTGEVQIEEFPSDSHRLWECAENGSKFFDALAIAAKFLGRCSWDTDLYDDQAVHKQVAEMCTAAAGGDRYRDFYLVICGCD